MVKFRYEYWSLEFNNRMLQSTHGIIWPTSITGWMYFLSNRTFAFCGLFLMVSVLYREIFNLVLLSYTKMKFQVCILHDIFFFFTVTYKYSHCSTITSTIHQNCCITYVTEYLLWKLFKETGMPYSVIYLQSMVTYHTVSVYN